MADPTGLKVPGNLDPYNRPVLNNPDGSVSTTSSISIGTDQGETVIPTVVDGKRLSKKNPDGTDNYDEAIQHFKETGQHFGIFDNAENANVFAEDLYNKQAASMGLGSPPVTPTSVQDDLGSRYAIGKQQEKAATGANDFETWMASQEGSTPAAPTGATPADPSDPHGLSLSGVLGGTWAVAKDIGRGVTEAIPQAAGGAVDAVNNTLQAVSGVADWLNDNLDEKYQFIDKENGVSLGADKGIPTTDKAKSVTGGLIRGISTFLTGFIPMIKGIRMLSGATKVTSLAGWAQAEAAAFAASGLVFDPHEERLSNLIQSFPTLQNPVTSYLQSDPNDGEAEGRFKQALEGLGIGATLKVAEGFVSGIKAIRANRIAQGIEPITTAGTPPPADGTVRLYKSADEGDLQVTSNVDNVLATAAKTGEPPKLAYVDVPADHPALAGGKDTFDVPESLASKFKPYETAKIDPKVEPAPSALGDPKEAFVPKEVMEAYDKGKLTSDEVIGKMNFAQLTSPEALSKALNMLVKMKKGEVNTLVDKKNLPNIGRSGVTVSDATVQEGAKLIGVTPQDLVGPQSFMRGNKALDAEHIGSVVGLLKGSMEKVQELGRKASDPALSTNQDRYDFVRMMRMHSAIQQYFKGYASEAGRALRSLQVPFGSTARQIAAMNEALMEQGGPAQVSKIARIIGDMNDPELISKAINETYGQKLGNAVSQYWYWDLLGGYKTQIVNLSSNALNTVWNIPVRALAAQFGELRGSTNSIEVGEASHLLYGLVNSFGDGLRAMAKTFKTGEQAFSTAPVRENAISGKSLGIKRQTWENVQTTGQLMNYVAQTGADALGSFFTYTSSRPLMAVDEFFQTINRSAQMQALAFRTAAQEGLEGTAMATRIREIMENPPEKMMDEAIDFGRASVFAQPLGETGTAFMAAINKYPAARAIVPFMKTPVNIFKWPIDNSPLGFFATSVKRDISGANGAAARDLALAKMSAGSLLALTMLNKVWDGSVTGAGPQDPGLQATWRLKNQPFSVKLDGTSYSYNRLDPFGLLLGATATYAEVHGQIPDDELNTYATAIATATSKSVFSKSFMKGPSGFLEASQDPQRYGAKWVDQMAGTFLVGQFVSQPARLIDPVWRDVQTLGDAIRSRVPGLSKSLPARTNIWGEPIMTEGGLGDRMFNPIQHMQDKDRPIDNVMLEKQIPISMPTRSQMGVQLTPQEYHDFVTDAGQRSFQILNQMAENGTFTNLSGGKDGMAALIIRQRIAADRQIALANLMKQDSFKSRVSQAMRDKFTALGTPDVNTKDGYQ